jgi:signal transduction histidine kinase
MAVIAGSGAGSEVLSEATELASTIAAGNGAVAFVAGGAADLIPLALGHDRAVGAPISVQGRTAGALWASGVDGLAADEDALAAVRLAADQIGATLENLELRESLERAMAQILERDERMLGRIGLDIHDGPTQQLSVALLEVQLLEAELSEADRQGIALPEALRPAMSRIYETVGGALHEMRELIGHLRPAQFEDRTLPEILGDAITAFEAGSGATVASAYEGEFAENGISITQRITFYRVLQEALANAHRHGAASECVVTATESTSGIRLRVVDNGSGFDVDQAMRPRSGAPMARFGLHGMRDRAELLGGTCDIESTEEEGSSITIFLPRWERPGAGDGD